MDSATKLLETFIRLINVCKDTFGAGFTMALLASVPTCTLAILVWRFWRERQRDKQRSEVIELLKQENTRLIENERHYRAAELKEKGWSDEQINERIYHRQLPPP